MRMIKLTVLSLPLLLVALASACGGGDAGSSPGPPQPSVEPTKAVTDADREGDSSSSQALVGALNPLALLSNLSGQPAGLAPASQEAEESLKPALLELRDLPASFSPLGEFSFSFSLPNELGDMEMVANMFAAGDLASGDFGAMVMSAALSMPPSAIAEMGGLSDLEGLNEADLEEMLASANLSGLDFDMRLLDASDLGDGGFGMHMEMDSSGLSQASGLPNGESSVPSAFAMEAYYFLHGDRMLMVMVMWPADESSGVDARALAETMDAKADATFSSGFSHS